MSKERILIDELQPTDNQAILELSHRCPQKGVIEGYPDRSPRFQEIHKLISKKSYHIVARQGENLVGAFGAAFTKLHYEGKDIESAYLMDLKVDPEHQRSTVAFRVVKETIGRLEPAGADVAIATFLKNNQYSLIFTKNRAGIPKAFKLGEVKIFSIIPLFKKRLSKEFEVGIPSKDDIRELVNLYNNYYSKFKLAPRMTVELLNYYTTQIKGMSLEQFRVARKDGKIKAVICAWDEDHYKRWYVNRMSRKMKIMSFFLKAFGLIMKMPAPIREKNSFKHISLVLSAHDNCYNGMSDLLRTINNFYRGKKYTILQTHFHENDPTTECVEGLQGFNVNAELFIFPKDESMGEKLSQNDDPVHFEWPMFI